MLDEYDYENWYEKKSDDSKIKNEKKIISCHPCHC